MLNSNRTEKLFSICAVTAIVLGLYLSSLYSYLLFHSLIEITTIAIACTLFILTWNIRRYLANGYLRLLGIGYAFIALIDLLHTLAYKGMGVFPGYGPNLPTQLWIAARYLQVVTLFAAPLFVERKVTNRAIIGIYAITVSVLVALVYSGNFPVCYIEGKGLTAFKISSEYVISAFLLTSLYLFYRKRKCFDNKVVFLIAASIGCTVLSEISFTAYVSVYGFANLVGHFSKLAAFYLIYQAILVTGLQQPFALIFRDLKQAEESLRKSQDTLEEKVRERTAELRAGEERYRSLIQKVQAAIVLHNGQGRILDSNHLARELLGLSANQMLGKALIDPEWHFLREDGSVMPVSEYPASLVLSTRQPLRDYMAGISRPDREDVTWTLVNAEPEYDEIGEIEQVIVSFIDITARKQAEQALKRIEWMLSKKHTSAMAGQENDQGYGDLTAQNHDGIILKSVGPEVLSSIAADYLDLLGTSSAIYEINGDYAFGIFASNWCRMLDRASRKLCNTADNTAALSSGQWLCHESCWTCCSKVAIATRAPVDIECSGGIRLYGVPIIADETVIGSINFGYGDMPQDPVKLQALANAYHLNDEDLIAECNAYDSRPPYIVEMAKRRLHASARLIGALVERRRAESEIRTLNQELEQRVADRTAQLEAANKELESFAYSVSHDLRTPLRHINGFMELLEATLGTTLDDEGRHYMESISNAARKMGVLIDDLLSFSRMRRQAISFQRVAPGDLVRDIIRDLEPDAADRTIDWHIGDLPKVYGDAAMLRMVLDNLISNALKFTRPRHETRIDIGSMPGQTFETVIYVRDNGVGFDMAYADKLFGVFQRLHRADEFEGTGIGLANVHRIITRHGGRVWAEGEIDKGAAFYFSLPQK